MTPELAAAIRASAQRLGVNPVDLGTVVSYETAGTFDPWKRGPTTQWGQHRGLIQWGEPQRQRYGVYEGMPVADQMRAAEQYLKNAGVQPGMGLLDLYSAVNAGRVGRYNASDANNGGAPGTVADKVNFQMEGHRRKAEQLLALAAGESASAAPAPAAEAPGTPATAPQSVQQSQPSAPLGLLGSMTMAPSETPEQAAAFQQQVQGLLAQATNAGQQPPRDEPGGLMSQQFRPLRTKRRRG